MLSQHPAIDQVDVQSYLEGDLGFHLVERAEDDYLVIDSDRLDALDVLHDRFSQEVMEGFCETLCQQCALARATLLGGTIGNHRFHYTTWSVVEGDDEDTVLLTFPDGVKILGVYVYGGADLGPGVARTAPCVSCQVETLACGLDNCDEHKS